MSQRSIPKWQRFAKEYLVDLNATKAAIRSGYSERSAYSQGARLLRDDRVKAFIQEETAKREKRTEIKQDQVLEEIAKIAFADIKDFLKYRTVKVRTGTDADGKPIYEHRQEIILKPSSKVDGAMIGEVSISKQGVFSFKLHDKGKHLEMLARHLGILKEPTVNVNVNVDLPGRMKAARERAKRAKGDTGKP
jgi:phage terminase small subunit